MRMRVDDLASVHRILGIIVSCVSPSCVEGVERSAPAREERGEGDALVRFGFVYAFKCLRRSC